MRQSDFRQETPGNAESFEEVARTLDEPIKQHAMSVVSDAIEANARFQYDAGLQPKIVREAEHKCCEWCSRLEGSFRYPDEVPVDVYRRHDRCRCTVDYVVGKKRRNIHNDNIGKKRRYVKDEYGNYAKTKEERIGHAKKIAEEEKIKKESSEFIRKFKDKAVRPSAVVGVMRKDAENWINSLTPEEIQCIQKYTFNGPEKRPKFYERLNAMLRGESEEDENLRYYASVISGALRRSELGENVICYRGVDTNPVVGIGIGNLISLEQFTSTTINSSRSFDNGVKIVIYAKKGTKGAAYIEKISEMPKQRELLFDKGCIYKVLSNQEDFVELEVI